VVDAVRIYLQENQVKPPEEEKIIALLPGSRIQEVKMALPAMLEMARKYPQYQFSVAAVNSLPEELYEVARGIPNVTLVFEDTYKLLSEAYAAIVTSGTATLETALFNVPQVVVYKAASRISYLIARAVVSVKYLSLVNLISDKPVLVELLQGNLNTETLEAEFIRLTGDPVYRETMKAEYEAVRKTLGSTPVSETAAQKMYGYLKELA